MRPLLARFFAIFAFTAPASAGEQVDLALVIATDTSRSIDEQEARLQREGVAAALRHPDIIAAIQSGYQRKIGVAYIDWSSSVFTSVVVNWRTISDQASADAYARLLTDASITLGQRTSISEGLELATKLLLDGSMDAPRKVIDISGDGPNNHGRGVEEVRNEVVARGITINGLPILNDRDQFGPGFFLPDLDDYYRGCVIGGPGAFVIVARDFVDFAQAVRRKLIFEIAGRTPAMDDRPRRMPVQGSLPDAQRFGSGFVYQRGCDVGERQWRRQLDLPYQRYQPYR
jgi:hypothetical protein